MFPDRQQYEWFETHSRIILDRCKRKIARIPGVSEEPVTILIPGGDEKYPSFWIRDAVMQCRSRLIGTDNMTDMLELILVYQNGPEKRELANGLRVSPWAIADHINLPGLGSEEFQRNNPPGAVFFPGTYSSTDNQGDGSYGLRPADDDIYETVELTKLIVDRMETSKAREFLHREIKSISIIRRLHSGMQTMTVDSKTGLCMNTPTDWSASNFHDGLKPMGWIALTSCLRFRAAKSMEYFFSLLGKTETAEEYRNMSGLVSKSVPTRLQLPSGWLMVGSEVGRQPDVWATSMAVYYGLLYGDSAKIACEAMLKVYKDRTVAKFGYLRHTPTTADVISGKQVWEGEMGKKAKYGFYQNGGYWPQPLGYYCYCLSQVDIEASRKIACEFIDHTRNYSEDGAPFEWLNPDVLPEDKRGEGHWYGPSAALPLEGFRRLSQTIENVTC